MRLLGKVLISVALLLYMTSVAEGAKNEKLDTYGIGTNVILEGNRGIMVNKDGGVLILLEKSICKSFDTAERNDYNSSTIKGWLNDGFKSTLVNGDWVEDNSINLLSCSEATGKYKEYLSEFSIGWLNDKLEPAPEPIGDLIVDNTWNYVAALMNNKVVGVSYGANFFSSPIQLKLKHRESDNKDSYKLKKMLGKHRVIIPNSSAANGVGWEESGLEVGDKVRFSNKWWTLVDLEDRVLLGEFDSLNYYVKKDEEVPETINSSNLMQFSSDVTRYNEGEEYVHSISNYLNADYKKEFPKNEWLISMDIPTKEQYKNWNIIPELENKLGGGWLVYEEVEDAGGEYESTKIYIVDGKTELTLVNPGEVYPLRILIKLKQIDLYIDGAIGGYLNITDDPGKEDI